MLRRVVESLPGGPILVGVGESLGKHPIRYVTAIGCLGLAGYAGVGAWQGKFETSVSVETAVEVEDQGRGEIVAIDLEIPERPLVGFTADVTGAKTVLSRAIEGKVLGINVNIPAGSNWVTLAEQVPTVISYDPSKLTAQYDPGELSDETDDRIIISAPIDSFSVTNHIEPDREDYEFHGDWMNLPQNYVSALTHSFDALKNLPGVGDIDDAANKIEESLLGITRVNILNNVADVCTPKVSENVTVAKAIRENIAKEAAGAVAASNDPALLDLTVRQLNTMKTVVYIGDESDAQPFLPNQSLQIQNPYTEKMTAFNENPEIKFESNGEFECELSDEVKALLADEQDTTEPTGSPSAPATEGAKND